LDVSVGVGVGVNGQEHFEMSMPDNNKNLCRIRANHT